MISPLIQIVTAPEPGADVIFDFNDPQLGYQGVRTSTARTSFSLGSPARLAAAGDARSAWGDRLVEFETTMVGRRVDALPALSVLNRWLLQPEGWVLFQLDEQTDPLWIRMKGADPGDLQLLRADSSSSKEDVWRLSISFDADPFLYGERVTLATAETVSMDAASGLALTIGDVPGDAPAPLRLAVNAGTNHGNDEWRITSLALPMSAPTDGLIRKSIGAPNDGMVGTSGAVFRVTTGDSTGWQFDTTSFADRVQGQLTPSPPRPGSYRAMMRVRLPSATAAFEVGVNLSGGTAPVRPIRIQADPAATGRAWVDVGEFVLPGYLPPGLPPSEMLTSGPGVRFFARRVSGSGPIEVDAIVLVPTQLVDEVGPPRLICTEPRTLASPSWAGAHVVINWDGDHEAAWVKSGAGEFRQVPPSTRGGWPQVTPGAKNVLAVMRTAAYGSAVTNDHPTNSVTVTASCHPRWLYLPNGEAL